MKLKVHAPGPCEPTYTNSSRTPLCRTYKYSKIISQNLAQVNCSMCLGRMADKEDLLAQCERIEFKEKK